MTRFSRAVRQQVSQRANHRCEYCGLPNIFSFQPYQIDHIRAIKHGGSDDLSNLAWTCADCNNKSLH
jgi:5-methylcytosine-specific restriction endonuclease McrA